MNKNSALKPGYGYKLIYYDNVFLLKGNYDIFAYNKNTVILKCGEEAVCIRGEELLVDAMDVESIKIKGKIYDISFA